MRLDVYLVEAGYVRSRARAKELIEGGHVTFNGEIISKASFAVGDGEHDVTVNDELPYVSRGGLKLAHALEVFEIDVSGIIHNTVLSDIEIPIICECSTCNIEVDDAFLLIFVFAFFESFHQCQKSRKTKFMNFTFEHFIDQ